MDKAKTIRDSENLTLCVVTKDDRIIKSTERGIYPLYNITVHDIMSFHGAYVADRVIGLAAALLLVKGKVQAVDTDVISDLALSTLQDAGIVVTYRTQASKIMNRQGDGRCPVETMAMKAKDTDELIIMIEGFLKKVGML